ncbi:hypothetical protein [Parvularcula oceani]|uniref:F0F1 ATP synthase subunit B family protein n=1 Tax=Parvularcula oceani TaxID=1247963 RepID=UPI0009DCA5E6|nr:hypothetical protein [Parvularcula oceani]
MRAYLTAGASALALIGMAIAAEPVPGEEAGGLPQLDPSTYASQIFWLLLTFGALYFVMSRIFLPRLGGVIEERRNRIADDYDQAADFKRQAEEAEAGYEKALADARARAASIAAETKASIDAEIAEMEEESETRLEGEIAAAEARIAETAEKARDAVAEAARETTQAIVEALIDETPSQETVNEALSNVRSEARARAA